MQADHGHLASLESVPDAPASARTSYIRFTAQTQLLRFETISDKESRRAVLVMNLIVLLQVFGTAGLVSARTLNKASEMFVMNRSFAIVQVATNSSFVAVLMLGFLMWARSAMVSQQHGMKWTRRRKGVAMVTIVRGALLLAIVAGQLALNTYFLAVPSSFCRSHIVGPLLDLFIWLCWNTVLLVLLFEAHSMCPVRDEQFPNDGANNLGATANAARPSDRVVFDLPLHTHWPKLLLWLAFAALAVWKTVLAMEDGQLLDVTVLDGGECKWGAELECTWSPAVRGGIMAAFACVAIYHGMYAFYLHRGTLTLRTVAYDRFRMANLVHRLQVQFNAAMMGALFVGLALTVLTPNDLCVGYATTLFGNTPIIFMFVGQQMVLFYLAFPRPPDYSYSKLQRGVPIPLLQQYAWTEEDMLTRDADRAAALGRFAGGEEMCQIPSPPSCLPTGSETGGQGAACTPAAAPLFCFETALKLFFWSALMYSYEEEEDGAVSLAAMPAPILEVLGEMNAAMRLFGLTDRHLFYDRENGTKALVAWSRDTILLSFRGTAEYANVIQDAKIFQTIHPPLRKHHGHVPRVHQGFLATWRSPSMHDPVLTLIRGLLTAAANPERVRVLCTGHSLGGAVAQLASFDIVRDLGVPPARVSVYTFGCPRLGNRALAAEFEEVVPDTWHIINDQDIVTRGMKIYGVYKRAGQRVLINDRGHMIVHPVHFEVSLLQRSFWSTRNVPLHETVRYQNALVAIIAARLCDSGRHRDNARGLQRLLQQLPRLRAALETHARRCGMPRADREQMRTAINGAYGNMPTAAGESPVHVVAMGEITT